MKIHPLEYASRVTAHEAGHVVVAWYCKTVLEVKVDLTDPQHYRTSAFGMAAMDPKHPPSPAGRLAAWERVAYSLGGIAAETVVLGVEPHLPGAAKDLVAAIDAAKMLRGWKAARCPWHTLDDSVDLHYVARLCQLPKLGLKEQFILRNGFAYARYLVSKSPHEVAALRSVLLDRRKADWNEIRDIFGPRPWAISRP